MFASISLISAPFLSFSAANILLVGSLGSLLRQLVFLLANAAFVYAVLGPAGFAATLGFCLIGYAMARLHQSWPELSLAATIPALVLLFIYMRNYEVLGFVVPEAVLLTTLRTVGLSFVLFKIIHVFVDLKGGAIRGFDGLTFLNYCLNFTTFMMGPIQRFQDYSDQWTGRKPAIPPTFEAHLDAAIRVLIGLAKVYIIGAFLADKALQPDTDILQLSPLQLMVMLYAFFFFLYMNFSGYCDVVIGIGSLLGVRPPENFNKPFLAQNISDFWLRQHRSLTLWLTDYVFTPAYRWALGTAWFGKRPLLAGNLAIALTMLVSGIWHGTTISFLFFGLAHALFLVIYHSWDHLLTARLGRKRVKALRSRWYARALGMFLTFNAASFAFLFFQLDTPTLLTLLGAAGAP